MYVRKLHVQNVKLLRDVKIDFVGKDGQPRMWTVFVGENRLCKTTLLQTIAAAASGVDRGTQLVTDVIASWPDLRKLSNLRIEAELAQDTWAARGPLQSVLEMEPTKRVFGGSSRYMENAGELSDPLGTMRAQGSPGAFVAGYGPSRMLPSAGKAARQSEPTLDRLRPLFGESLIGTGFVELLGDDLGRAFVKVLESVFVAGGVLPHVTAVELRGRGGLRSSKDLIDAQRFQMETGHQRVHVPATWLSQGYQSVIAWLADLVGQLLLDAGEPVEAAEMEGTVLVDEIDLHLHPTWQVRLIPALKKVFPRLQFIATTHSPMVLPALAAEEIILLSQDAEGSVVATPSTQSPALLTGSELYSAFFEIRKLYPDPLGDKLHRYGYLANDPTRTDEEDGVMRALRGELESAGVTFDWEAVPREAAE